MHPELLIHKSKALEKLKLLLLFSGLTKENFEFQDARSLFFNYGWRKGKRTNKKNPDILLFLRALLLWWPFVPGWWGLAPWSVLQMCLQGWRDSVLHSFLWGCSVQTGQDSAAFWGHYSWLSSFPWQDLFLMQTYKIAGRSGWFEKRSIYMWSGGWVFQCKHAVSSPIHCFSTDLFVSCVCCLIEHNYAPKKWWFWFLKKKKCRINQKIFLFLWGKEGKHKILMRVIFISVSIWLAGFAYHIYFSQETSQYSWKYQSNFTSQMLIKFPLGVRWNRSLGALFLHLLRNE